MPNIKNNKNAYTYTYIHTNLLHSITMENPNAP